MSKKGYCQWKGDAGTRCRRPLYDDIHCVFHSHEIDGKKEKFKEAFWTEFERQEKEEGKYDFSGFVFPGDISFCSKKFEKDVEFLRAKFLGGADFSGAQFSGYTNFLETQFFRWANFRGAQFSGIANFGIVRFLGNMIFLFTKFSEHAIFNYSQLYEKVIFDQAKFLKGVDFQGSVFVSFHALQMQDTYFYDIRGLLEFIQADREKEEIGKDDLERFNKELSQCKREIEGEADRIKAEQKLKKFRDKYAKYRRFNYLHETHRWKRLGAFFKTNRTELLPENSILILGESATAKYPILSRQIKDDIYLQEYEKKHPRTYFFWSLFADCGRSFFRWGIWSVGIALLFAAIFTPPPDFFPDWWVNCCNEIGPRFQQTTDAYRGKPLGFWSSLYFSIVTFTTLGFGDVVTANTTARILVTLEVILGYIMLGGLISILANKLARRS